ncbi:adenylate kinase, partial [Candidatus Woesearchaeota archaeon CG10_big_fil_rev_8_21_14_0_10_32_9]
MINRISGRRTCKECKAIYHITNIPTKVEGVCDKCGGETYQREDEKPEIVKERLVVYRKETF